MTRRAFGIPGLVYGLYVWLGFVAVVLIATTIVLLVPGLERRRRWITLCARLPFRLSGMATAVHGLEHLPPGHCIVVANHASYLDGVLLQAWLPARFSFVIKGEMGRVPVASFLLRRIGSRFVDRFDPKQGARDARRLVRAAGDGESLAFFPEGTFEAEPGLGQFRHGAFVAAIRAGVPVVPVVISGSRRVLPADRWLPRRGPLGIDILEPIGPDDPAYADGRRLAEAARQRILRRLDEPDRTRADGMTAG